MSSLLAFENSEALQHDPARAGIFNFPEQDITDDVDVIVDRMTDLDLIAGTFPDIKLVPKQLAMVGALMATNGEQIRSRDILDPFPGLEGTKTSQFSKLINRVLHSKYKDILDIQILPQDRKVKLIRWDEPSYDRELMPLVQERFWYKLGSLAIFDSVKESGEVMDLKSKRDPIQSSIRSFTRPQDTSWQDKALCAQTDPEIFFPSQGGSTRDAKKICLRCEVSDECKNFALANQEEFGVWGDLNEGERKQLLKKAV